MIRLVWIGDQIAEGRDDFALYDTVRDRFLRFSGSDVWGSWESLEESVREDPRFQPPKAQEFLDRVRPLVVAGDARECCHGH